MLLCQLLLNSMAVLCSNKNTQCEGRLVFFVAFTNNFNISNKWCNWSYVSNGESMGRCSFCHSGMGGALCRTGQRYLHRARSPGVCIVCSTWIFHTLIQLDILHNIIGALAKASLIFVYRGHNYYFCFLLKKRKKA